MLKQSNRLWKYSKLSLQGVIGLVTVGHHTKTISHPETDEVLRSVSLLPGKHASKIVVILKLHVFNHPLEALSIAVIPGAETSSLLWPEINHFTSHVSRVWNNWSNSERWTHEDELTEFITDIVVDPEQEELILQENVEVDIGRPEQELICDKWESSLEQIAWSLFKWNSEQSLSGRSIVSSKLEWPGLIGIVCSSGVLEWDSEPRGWTEGKNSANQWLVRVTICEFLWGPSTTKNVLPCSKLNSGITTCGNEVEASLFGKVFPEVGESEHLLKENVVFLSSFWPLVEMVHYLSIWNHMLDGSKL